MQHKLPSVFGINMLTSISLVWKVNNVLNMLKGRNKIVKHTGDFLQNFTCTNSYLVSKLTLTLK